jgi:hypothetical protein
MVRMLAALAALFIVMTSKAAENQIPATPAGQEFSEWLSSGNRHDRDAMDAFIKRYKWSMDLDQELAGLQQDGGYSIVAVEQSEPDALAVRVKTLSDGLELIAKLDITNSTPPKILLFGMYEAPQGAKFLAYKIDANIRHTIADRVAAAVRNVYFDRGRADRKNDCRKGKSWGL